MALMCENIDFVDQQEKLLLFNAINKTNVSSNALFCFVCEKWLSAPIYSKAIGVYICGRCYDENDKTALGYHREDLETFLSGFKFPCKYNNKGCPLMTSFTDIDMHEENCNVITDMWKDFYCCACEFKCPKGRGSELIKHYKKAHKVPTITAELKESISTGQFERTTQMLFVKMSSNLFALKLSKNSKLQICHALGAMPQFELQVTCTSHSECDYIYISVNTNLNQLKWEEGETLECREQPNVTQFSIDKRRNYSCNYLPQGCLGHSSSNIICSYGLVQCGDQSITFAEHYDYFKKNNELIKNALIKREVLDETKVQYITLDDNIFRLMNNTLDKLCWFGGNWEYSVYVFLKDVVQTIATLELAEIHKLPEEWDMLYFTRGLKN